MVHRRSVATKPRGSSVARTTTEKGALDSYNERFRFLMKSIAVNITHGEFYLDFSYINPRSGGPYSAK